jgi:hypothetical protein
MKTEPYRSRRATRQRNTLGLLTTLTVSALLLAAVIALTSCTMTISPDGSKSATVDAPSAIRVIEIIATK